MKRRTSLIYLSFALILFPTTLARLQAQQRSAEQPAKLEVEKAVLDFQIKKKGEFVGGLKKEDLSVYEDDVKTRNHTIQPGRSAAFDCALAGLEQQHEKKCQIRA